MSFTITLTCDEFKSTGSFSEVWKEFKVWRIANDLTIYGAIEREAIKKDISLFMLIFRPSLTLAIFTAVVFILSELVEANK